MVTTAGRQIGTGHLRRCLTLAAAIRERGGTVRLILHDTDDPAGEWMRTQGVEAERHSLSHIRDLFPEAARQRAILVVDSYQVSSGWLTDARTAGLPVLVIDDLIDRPLPATWLTNCAVMPDSKAYDGLTSARLLLGPAYAILRGEFRDIPPRRAVPRVKNILVTFGGSDPTNMTPRVMRMLSQLEGSFTIQVVIGPLFLHREECERAIANNRHIFNILTHVENMNILMCQADMAISAAGQTMFELAATGCPSIGCQVADNQEVNIRLFSRLGCARGLARPQDEQALRSAVVELIESSSLRESMMKAGQVAVDGRGAGRLADIVMAS